MNDSVLFEETIVTNRGHGRMTVKVELGGDGAVQVVFEGREAPTVTYQYTDPADAQAIGAAMIRAANAAVASRGMETG